jgi:hypothetical protein
MRAALDAHISAVTAAAIAADEWVRMLAPSAPTAATRLAANATTMDLLEPAAVISSS